VAEVAALSPLYATGNGTFDTETLPTLAQVEKFIDQVSGAVNVLLAEAGFTIPVSQADAKLALDGFVAQEAAGLVAYANGAGPFIPSGMYQRAESPNRIILKDAEAFIEAHAQGFELLGAARTRTLTNGLDAASVDPPFSFDWSG
jgi:hypothetical protein